MEGALVGVDVEAARRLGLEAGGVDRVADHDRGPGDRAADVFLPADLAGAGVEGEEAAVQLLEEHPAVRDDRRKLDVVVRTLRPEDVVRRPQVVVRRGDVRARRRVAVRGPGDRLERARRPLRRRGRLGRDELARRGAANDLGRGAAARLQLVRRRRTGDADDEDDREDQRGALQRQLGAEATGVRVSGGHPDVPP